MVALATETPSKSPRMPLSPQVRGLQSASPAVVLVAQPLLQRLPIAGSVGGLRRRQHCLSRGHDPGTTLLERRRPTRGGGPGTRRVAPRRTVAGTAVGAGSWSSGGADVRQLDPRRHVNPPGRVGADLHRARRSGAVGVEPQWLRWMAAVVIDHESQCVPASLRSSAPMASTRCDRRATRYPAGRPGTKVPRDPNGRASRPGRGHHEVGCEAQEKAQQQRPAEQVFAAHFFGNLEQLHHHIEDRARGQREERNR